MKSITVKGSRLDQLKQLAKILATNIDECQDARALPALAKQYRETVQEINELEGATGNDDEIDKILAKRQQDGKSGAVRTHRSGV